MQRLTMVNAQRLAHQFGSLSGALALTDGLNLTVDFLRDWNNLVNEGGTGKWIRTMRNMTEVVVAVVAVLLVCAEEAGAQAPADMGTEEFGMTERELFQSIDQVESLIANCMREQGFQYFAVDNITFRNGMLSDKTLPGISEEEFIDSYGFGISTMYTGAPPQLATGYSPGKIGLGEQNVRLYQNLSPTDQDAYNQALFGDNVGATFAIALEAENFSRTGGCTRKAIEQVFQPEQLNASYYNPKDALINKDPRMQAALRTFSAKMRQGGFEYDHPDDIEPDIRERLAALTSGGTVPVEQMSADQQAALEQLQDYERRVGAKYVELVEEIIDPVEATIEKEMFPREIK